MEKSIFRRAWSIGWESHFKVKQLLFSSAADPNVQTNVKVISKNEKPSTSNKPAYQNTQIIGLLLGPLLFVLIQLFFAPEGLDKSAVSVLAVTLWIAVWWITEPVPIPVTSLLPLILLPITQAVDGEAVASSYGDPIIFLFLGGFMIAIAMEKWNLHKRIAILIVSKVGASPKRIVLGFMLATGFLSMWVSNTAAVMMMMPIGTAITHQALSSVKNGKGEEAALKTFEKCVIFGIGFAGTVGGFATLIGTPPNIILAATAQKLYNLEISFASWLFFAAPIALILILFTWLYLVNVVFRVNLKELPGGKKLIEEERKNLGNMSFEEKAVLFVFVFTAFMWISRTFLWADLIPGISDAMIAIFAGVLLFLIPSTSKGGKLLDWGVSRELPWGVLLLFGGGLAIAGGFKETGLASWIGEQLIILEGTNILVTVFLTTLLVLFLTEITSNMATATMILPILASLSLAINVHPLALMVPAAMAANCAFMLPVGTPPNAIIYSTGKITISEMVKAGFWINILASILIVIAVFLILPSIMDIDLTVFPITFK